MLLLLLGDLGQGPADRVSHRPLLLGQGLQLGPLLLQVLQDCRHIFTLGAGVLVVGFDHLQSPLQDSLRVLDVQKRLLWPLEKLQSHHAFEVDLGGPPVALLVSCHLLIQECLLIVG